MANQQQLSLLKEGVEGFNKWRSDNPNEQADLLPEAKLGGVYPRGTFLTGAIPLRESYLRKSDLPEAKLSEANLGEANLGEANLGGADLSRADLTRADLTRADLYLADLSGANLSGANMSGAILSMANLTGANLSGANLSGADLSMAFLTGADLGEANLSRANLDRADLGRAKLSGTLLGNLDLSATLELTSVIHDGPSTLGIDALYRSRGEIPDEFLLGVGLTNLFITYARDTINAESGPLFAYYSAFLSYSHADAEPVQKIYEQLTQRGIPCWLDEHQLSPGDKLDTHVDQAIRGADKVVVFCSKASLSPGSNWWVDREVGRTLNP